jgi:GTP-binding protein
MKQQINPEQAGEPVPVQTSAGPAAPLPIIAIVGRPNVGKSSLFNRILARRHAIVSEVAGTTRDRLMADADWDDYQFILVDTGGLESNPEGHIRQRVQEQSDMAQAQADVIIFVAEAEEGLTPNDQLIADRLRRSEKPVILAVNKVDNDNREFAASEFYQLGIPQTVMISAYHNYGIYDLMDRVLSYLPAPPQEGEDENGPGEGAPSVSPPKELRLSIVGRTNVGKSMLLNAILGEDRSIVSDVAGTTRDALDTPFAYQGQSISLIDTAGIRRPGQVQRGIEKYSVLRAVNAVNRSDITLLITDASELATAQDAHIAGLAWDMCRGMIAVINKWDLISETGRYSVERAIERVRDRLHFMSYVPICFTSALRGEGIEGLMDMSLNLWRERQRWVSDRQLQYMLAEALIEHNPPSVKIRRRERLRIDRLRQVGSNPPTFVFTVNYPHLVHFSYQRYLENRIRETFGFNHTHLKLIFRRR